MTLLTHLKNGRQEQIIEPVSFPRDLDERTVIKPSAQAIQESLKRKTGKTASWWQALNQEINID